MFYKFDRMDARPLTLREVHRLVQGTTIQDLIYEIDPIPFFVDADEGTIDF